MGTRSSKTTHRIEAKPSLASLIDSWKLHLAAARKAPKTIRNYLEAATQMVDILTEAGMPTAADVLGDIGSIKTRRHSLAHHWLHEGRF